MSKIQHFYKSIEELRNEYYQLLPGKETLVNMINEKEVSEQVYNSNAIESSTLTLEETERILMEIDVDRYISERELFEAKNLARVSEYIHKKAKDHDLDNSMILLLHRMLISNIQDDIAGRFREKGEYVKVANHIAPAPERIENLLQDVFTAYLSNTTEHIVRKISRFHLAFENIHPFIDGNGRIGRVLNNYLLLRKGYVPINIRFVDRTQYYEAFSEYDDDGSTETMENIIGIALMNSYHKRISYLKGEDIISLKEYAEYRKISYSNLLNKAKRQTIPAFQEGGKWKIGKGA